MQPQTPATPAIATQAAVRRLPRWTLLLLCLAYTLPGFLARAPWKNADIASFGVMSHLAQGQTDWWHPTYIGQALDTPALLPYWLGAWAMQLLPQHTELAARLPFMVALLGTFFLTWHAVFRFALLPSAQPVAFAFGGEAPPVDYARSLADGGLLALLACLGLAQLSHETTPSVLQLLATAALLRSMASFVTPGRPLKPRAVALWVLGLVTLGLSGAPFLAVAVSLLPLPVGWAAGGHAGHTPPPQQRPLIAWGLGVLASASTALTLGPALLAEGTTRLPNMADAVAQGQLMFWFTWPVWPLALWTLWRWRRHLGAPHLRGPLWLTGVVVVASALGSGSDRTLLLALPALSLLAAFALPTLKRSVTALLDWFSVLFFSLCALTVWVVWLAMLTGVPAKPAANVARLAPGFVLEFSGLGVAMATLGTAAWLWVVRWRLGKHPSVLWKSLVLPATGGTLCWLLLMTLWMPLLDFARSYAPISRRIASMVPPHSCTEVFGLTQAQLAGLAHHGKLNLKRAPSADGCATMVVAPQAADKLATDIDLTRWAFKARLSRLTDNKESLLLYQRVAPPTTLPLEKAPETLSN